MAGGINRLIATQQAPDLLGAVTGGIQAGQSMRANEMNMQRAQAAQQRQNRLLELAGQGAQPEQMMQEGFIDEASKLVQIRSQLDANQQAEFDRDVQEVSALTAGARTPEEFNQRIMNAPEGLLSPETQQIAVGLGPQGLQQLAGQLGKGQQQDIVQSSEILPDGTVQLVYKSGKVDVVTQDEANKKLVQDARRFGAEVQRQRSQGREMGAGTAKIALESFDKIGDIRSNVSSLRDVISAVGEGAETGPLADRLPSFRASTIKLNTLKNQLGLDVVGSVTFGALSEGELKLALDTALPTSLDGPELVDWAEKKAEAQEKLAANLEEAAVFLSNPDNTLADWIEVAKEKRKQGELPQGVTEDDIQTTMQANNMTREQVLQRLRGQ